MSKWLFQKHKSSQLPRVLSPSMEKGFLMNWEQSKKFKAKNKEY